MKLIMRVTHKGTSCIQKGILFVLAKNCEVNVPTDGRATEFMITGGLTTHPNGFIVEPVTKDCILVKHQGFECPENSRLILANTENHGLVSPGKVDRLVHIARTGTLRIDGRADMKPQPGKVYIKTGDHRAIGIPGLTADMHARHKKDAEYALKAREESGQDYKRRA